ncbi:hypothetical protein L2E82_49555 [Cichorium intybus]|uniref:Uncharacterized protein n=1 Tax=Cichorium intybus TaxID=13427 RepID=A0ACB8Z1W6_CICIN|nr:hypothetical protein L2E82_49555 [Cichorium intybus]
MQNRTTTCWFLHPKALAFPPYLRMPPLHSHLHRLPPSSISQDQSPSVAYEGALQDGKKVRMHNPQQASSKASRSPFGVVPHPLKKEV